MKVCESLIIESLKRGEEKAYRYLFDHHYVVLCKLANGFLQDSFWAETIVDDIFFHLWEIRETLDIKTSLRSYLVQAVRNRCINHLQSEKEKNEIILSQLPLETMDASFLFKDHQSSPLGLLLERELEDKIKKAVSEMPKETLAVFKKSRFEHKKNEEIAAELNISVNTVKYHIKKALAFLRESLGAYMTILLILLILWIKS